MQTRLRVFGCVVVASLLWTSPTPAATQKVKAQKTNKKLRIDYVGTASWYGKQHQGRKMANGQRFDRNKLTAASWYFPLGTPIRVENLENGKSVVVTITDRGPNFRLHRLVDLSEAAASNLDYVEQGLTPVFLCPLMLLKTEAADFGSSQQLEPPSDRELDYQASSLNAEM